MEGDFDIFLTQLKKNFKVKVRLRVTKTFKHQKPKDLEYYWKKLEKNEYWASSSRKRKRGGGDCDFTSYRILNLSWYGISYMLIKNS